MKVTKAQTETYILTDVEGLDPIRVYVTNLGMGKGRVMIECYGSCWTTYWGGMSGQTIQHFMTSVSNNYILGRLVSEPTEIDYEQISSEAEILGIEISATNLIELHFANDEMTECFGEDWEDTLPIKPTTEYTWVDEIVAAVKLAFQAEINK